jgi:small subunit ribosomal protein S14
MAKTSMIEREKRRAKVVKKYAAKRALIKEQIRDPKASQEDRMAAVESLQKRPLAWQLPQVWPRPRQVA